MRITRTTTMIAAFATAVVASSASAAPTITSPSTLTLINLGTGNGAGFQNNAPRVGADATVTFTGATTGVYSGSNPGTTLQNGYTSPFGASNQDYFAVEPNGTVTIAYTVARTSFAALIGTLDSYNSITFSTAGVTGGQSFSGTDIANALGDAANGATSVNVLFSGLNAFNTVTFNDSTYSAFEFVPASTVPEAAAWGMMILGVGAIGFAMRRHKVATRVAFG